MEARGVGEPYTADLGVEEPSSEGLLHGIGDLVPIVQAFDEQPVSRLPERNG